jgi:hypothetical protein
MSRPGARGWTRCERRSALAFAFAFAALALASCGSPGILVPSHPHPEDAPAEPVLFLPPPARVEHIAEEPPAQGCLWADGRWVWSAQRWEWHSGSWIRPPANCRYSAPTVEWGPGGKSGILYYRPGRWYAVSEPETCPEPVSCPHQSPLPLGTEAPLGS